MDNTLTHLIDLEFFNTVKVAVIIQRLHLNTRHLIGHTSNTGIALSLVSRDIVIRGGNIRIQAPRQTTRNTQALKGLR